MANKIQNKIYDYHATVINDHDLAKRNQAKMKALADKYDDFYFERFADNLYYGNMTLQNAIDECWEFFKMEDK